MTTDDWRDRAKCRGEPLELYDVDSLPRGPGAPELRAAIAQARCSGCPVKQQCATEAINLSDVGVIRGGVAITGARDSSEYRDARRLLHRAAGRPYKSTQRLDWPRECRHCGCQIRPRGSDPTKFPADCRTATNRDTCWSCSRAMRKESA